MDLGGGRYDFSSVEPFIEAARRHGVEVIWDLFHQGYPEGLNRWSEEFPRRFADYCHAVGRYIAERTEGICALTPVNEPSFMAYAADEKGLFAPHEKGRGWDLKVALSPAAILGIDALRDSCPGARMVNVDPLCRVACSPEHPEHEEEARDFNERLVFQSWDMLCGHLLPELGGSREHLDVEGINYYWTNQWEWRAPLGPHGVVLPLADDDPRRWSLADLVRLVWGRYGGEVMVSETSHIGERRGRWLHGIAEELETLLLDGVPIRSVCLYPILGMPEWHHPDIWTPMGLWDPAYHGDPARERLVCGPMPEALQSVRHVDELHHALLAKPDLARSLARRSREARRWMAAE